MTALSVFYQIIRQECLAAFRQRMNYINALLFYVIVVALFPLCVSPDPKQLAIIAPGVIWVAALLSILLGLNQLFYQDYHDGTLEQMLISPHPLSLVVLAKITAHWLVTGLPLLIITPLLALFLSLPLKDCWPLLLSLLVGTPILCFIGAVAVSLTLGLKNSGLLLALLALPLYIPVLIFGASVVVQAGAGMPFSAQLYLLLAGLLLCVSLVPLAVAAALRNSV